MNKTFNLKTYLEKTAFYEGAQGYMQAQTRAWMNCVRARLASGEGPQDCWMGCLEEYQKGDGRIEWVQKYAQDLADKFPQEGVTHTSYADAIMKKVATGQPVNKAVAESIQEIGMAKTAETFHFRCPKCGKKTWGITPKIVEQPCGGCGGKLEVDESPVEDRKG